MPTTPLIDHADSPPVVVLDTNVVLDWLLFKDAKATALGLAIQNGAVRWAFNTTMAAEYERMFKPERAAEWGADEAAFRTACVRWGSHFEMSAPFCGLRCTDPDDQVFIDFALAHGVRWLVTRDKALLKLARRARDRGLLVLRPGDWESSAQASLQHT